MVLFAHPYYEYSHTSAELVQLYQNLDHIDVKDLYEEYPDFHIPAFRERKRLHAYERLIFHFPLIWFSYPPLLKLWIDEVFDMTWTEDSHHPLQNKDALIVVTIGGSKEQYMPGGKYQTTIAELLKSLTISLNMNSIAVKNLIEIYDADDLSTEDLQEFAQNIKKNLES